MYYKGEIIPDDEYGSEDYPAVAITLKCYCEGCGESYKLAAGEHLKCDCGTIVSRNRCHIDYGGDEE